MRTASALLLALALLAPAAARAQAPPPSDYPEALLALVPGWLREAEEAGTAPGADAYLQKARDAAREGSARVVLFHLDTHRQLLDAQRLRDEAGAGALPQQRARVLALVATWEKEAADAWEEYRRALRPFDDARSLHAAELALYSADAALVAAVQATGLPHARQALNESSRLDEGVLAGLARTTRGVTYQLSLARDVLDAAAALEGLPPRLDPAAWNRTLAEAKAPLKEAVAYYLEPLERVAGDSRARGEGVLALALVLAELRDARVAAIQQQLGDAAARGLDAVGDAARALGRAAANVSLAEPRSRGLLGVFTADALDRARYTVPLGESGAVGLGPVAFSWASLDHQKHANAVLLDALPEPEAPRGLDAPGPLAPAVAATVLLAALLTRRGRRA